MRAATVTAVILFHAAVIYAVAVILDILPPPLPPPGIDLKTIIEPAQSGPKNLPPIDTPVLPIPKTNVVPPVIDDGDGGGLGVGDVIAPRLDPRYPPGRPDYPAGSVRLGEEGKVVLALLVGADGSIADARVDRSSGHPALDAAALDHARRHVRFLPGTRNGVPASMWHRLIWTFRLSDARDN
jgi:protein TonB